MVDALYEYKRAKPRYVLSHECPSSVILPAFGPAHFDGDLLRPSRTAYLLQKMLDAHRPDIWFFGHYHRWYDAVIQGTNFVCLPETGVADLTVESGVITSFSKRSPTWTPFIGAPR
jgi:hypothetical protein